MFEPNLKITNVTQENKNGTDEIKLNIEEKKLGIKAKNITAQYLWWFELYEITNKRQWETMNLKIDTGTCTHIMKPLATDENFTIKIINSEKILIKHFSIEYEINLPIFKNFNVNKNDQIDTNKIKEFFNRVKIKQKNEFENFLKVIKFMT